jgi:hypothetical protein
MPPAALLLVKFNRTFCVRFAAWLAKEIEMGIMKDFLMTVEELVWDAIEAGVKTDEDVYAFVTMRTGREVVTLETIKQITKKFANEWM